MCDLLDLLGGSDAALQESSVNNDTPPASSSSSASGNLLDLLGGLESASGAFVSEFLHFFPPRMLINKKKTCSVNIISS